MYQAYGLLKPDSDFTLAAAVQRLAAKLPRYAIAQSDQRVTVSSKDWEIHLVLSTAAEVIDEARRLEEGIGGAQDDLGITACTRRVEVASDTPDPEMEHFEDYLSVIEVLKSFRGLIAVDPEEPSLL